MPPRRTVADLYELVEGRVLPELTDTKAIATEARELARKAGLNGFSQDIHDFFEQRSESQAAKQWLSKKIQPVTRFRALAFFVGFVASVGWAVMGVTAVVGLLTRR